MIRLFAITIFSSLLVQSAGQHLVHAAEMATCKVKTNDIGTIVGKGRNPSAAFEDAATKCFDRREKLYKMKNKQAALDEDSGMVMIDNCANIKCGV